MQEVEKLKFEEKRQRKQGKNDEEQEEEETGLTSCYYISYKPSDNGYKRL